MTTEAPKAPEKDTAPDEVKAILLSIANDKSEHTMHRLDALGKLISIHATEKMYG